MDFFHKLWNSIDQNYTSKELNFWFCFSIKIKNTFAVVWMPIRTSTLINRYVVYIRYRYQAPYPILLTSIYYYCRFSPPILNSVLIPTRCSFYILIDWGHWQKNRCGVRNMTSCNSYRVFDCRRAKSYEFRDVNMDGKTLYAVINWINTESVEVTALETRKIGSIADCSLRLRKWNTANPSYKWSNILEMF